MARLRVETPAWEPAKPPDVPAAVQQAFWNLSEGGHEGMHPGRRSPQYTKQDAPVLDNDAEIIEIETVPAECPGVFIEQPLERWSPRDLITGVFRLVRWTRLATS